MTPNRNHWRATLALAWAIVFGALYARMVIVDRLPMVKSWFQK